ncbi:MAG: hypothetical protein ACLPJJ_12070 [Acidocella sp.]|uniref:hypothetical protein n=1 Tax=Acidocella sp. TaxID=50710 RepID=UPI003FC77F07
MSPMQKDNSEKPGKTPAQFDPRDSMQSQSGSKMRKEYDLHEAERLGVLMRDIFNDIRQRCRELFRS